MKPAFRLCVALTIGVFAWLAVAIKERTETLFRLNRCPVIHVVENRVQLCTFLAQQVRSLPVRGEMSDADGNNSIKKILPIL